MKESKVTPLYIWAEKLGICMNTARKLAREKKLPGARRIGHKWFVADDEVNALFTSGPPEGEFALTDLVRGIPPKPSSNNITLSAKCIVCGSENNEICCSEFSKYVTGHAGKQVHYLGRCEYCCNCSHAKAIQRASPNVALTAAFAAILQHDGVDTARDHVANAAVLAVKAWMQMSANSVPAPNSAPPVKEG